MTIERHARHFQEELEQLKARLLEMGGLAEDRLRLAVRGLVERIVITPAAEGPGETIELVGAIARMVELGNKKATLDSRTACSVKVVAGACNYRQFALPPIPSKGGYFADI